MSEVRDAGRRTTVVLVVPSASRSGDTGLAQTIAHAEDGLGTSIARYGGSLEVLADGALLVRVTAATREARAENGARLALSLAASRPGDRVAVASTIETADDDATLERAARLAEHPLPPGEVRIDDETAELLDTTFVFERDADGLRLVRARDGLPEPGEARQPGVLARGDRVERYVVEGLLGRGGMGQVYRARDTRLSRWVALKILLARPLASDAAREEASARMLREARSAAAFAHPNVVSIFDVGEADGLRYLAMELIEGRTLRDFVGPETPWPMQLRWLLDVARALGAAHAMGLIHRDIKPENVIVREDGVAKVLDFGIARRSQLQAAPASDWDEAAMGTLTADGAVLGTPIYMAPEQLGGGVLDGRTDQFSWAVTAFEVLSGELPWPGASGSAAALFRARREPPRELSSLCPELPYDVSRAIGRALSASPEERWDSMETLALAIAPFAAASAEAVASRRTSLRPTSSSSSTAVSATAAQTGSGAATITAMTPVAAPRRPWIALAAVAATLLCAGLAWRVLRPSPAAALPAAYVDGTQLWRDGSSVRGARALRRAVEADPGLAVGHLRLALISPPGAEARAALQHAMALRASLGDDDRALLDASEPGFRPLPDLAAWEARLEALARAKPGEASYFLARVRERRGNGDGARAALTEAAKADPTLRPAASAALGNIERARFQREASRAALDECLSLSPTAADCLESRARLRGLGGDCAGMEADARAWVSVDPEDPAAHGAIAASLAARDAPAAAIREALSTSWAKAAGRPGFVDPRSDALRLAVLEGDFPRALEIGKEIRASVKPGASATEQYEATVWLALTAVEADDGALAASESRSYLARSQAWPVETPRDAAVGLLFLGILRNEQAIGEPEFRRERERWVGLAQQAIERSGKAVDPYGRVLPWILGYAAGTRTEAHANEALEVLPKFGEAPRPGSRGTDVDLVVGLVHNFAGHPAEARPYLETAGNSCLVLENPLAHFYARLALGKARLALGDREGARALFAEIVRRWGASDPPSRKVKEARALLAAMDAPQPAK